MKFIMILTTFCVAAVAATPADNELFGRNDCGKGGEHPTRGERTANVALEMEDIHIVDVIELAL